MAKATAAYGQSLLELGKYSEAGRMLRDALKSYDCPYDFLEGDRHLDILDCKKSFVGRYLRGVPRRSREFGPRGAEEQKASLGLSPH